MSTLAAVLLVWAVLLALLVAALALATRRRRAAAPPDRPRGRSATEDRRRGDRRVGLPDLRIDAIERRSGTDRRTRPADRRGSLGTA